MNAPRPTAPPRSDDRPALKSARHYGPALTRVLTFAALSGGPARVYTQAALAAMPAAAVPQKGALLALFN